MSEHPAPGTLVSGDHSMQHLIVCEGCNSHSGQTEGRQCQSNPSPPSRYTDTAIRSHGASSVCANLKSMRTSPFRMLYTDIGGVLGTNGWDSALRRQVCSHFGVAHEEVDRRHQLVFDSFERGFMTFEEYLRKVFLLSPYNFTLDEVRDYAYQASIPWPESIHLFRRVKIANKLGLGL